MDITALIAGYNEEENLEALFAPLHDLTDIVFIDHQSTDNTAKLAKSLGARVITREFPHDVVTTRDIAEFTKRYGWKPHFTEGEKMYKAAEERMICESYAKNDWILTLDCDEILTWQYPKIKRILPNYDVINVQFYHARNPDGTRRGDWIQRSKLYNRKKVWWMGRIHETINGYNLRIGMRDDITIDHMQRPRAWRSHYSKYLEYDVTWRQEVRSLYYLGIEYHHAGEWEKGLFFLTLYLKEAVVPHEKAHAYILAADSLYELGREDEAWIYAFQSIKILPTYRQGYLYLSQLAPKRDKELWVKHASLAEDNHLL